MLHFTLSIGGSDFNFMVCENSTTYLVLYNNSFANIKKKVLIILLSS